MNHRPNPLRHNLRPCTICDGTGIDPLAVQPNALLPAGTPCCCCRGTGQERAGRVWTLRFDAVEAAIMDRLERAA